MSLQKLIVFLRRVFACGLAVGLLAPAPGAAAAQKGKNPRAEEVVERAILAYGSRGALYAIQRNGILRGQITLTDAQGTREGRTATRFIRKQRLLDDLVMIELELPETKFIIGFDGKQVWSVHNGEQQELSPETAAAFRAAHIHSYEALLRYKENDSKLEYVGSKPFGTSELDIIDLVTPEGERTRYEISRRTSHILYLEYEAKAAPSAAPTKYRLHFTDFRAIQNTLVPYKTLVFQNGRQVEERKLVEVVYSVQLDEKAFKPENAGQPVEAAAKP